MFWNKKEKEVEKEESRIPWIELNKMEQLDQIKLDSKSKPVIIFKHSTRCSISSMAKNRFENTYHEVDADIYLLDLISYRDVSNAIAETFSVRHESPQALLIKEGVCVLNESHSSISFKNLAAAL